MLSDADSMEPVDYDWSYYMNVDAITNKIKGVAKVRQNKVKPLFSAIVDMF